MANLKARDADSVTRFIKAIGDGTDQSPLIIEHSDSAVLTKLDAISTSANQLTQITRLEQIRDYLVDLKTYTDGLENLLTLLSGYVDGLETLLGTANSTQSSLASFVDQLEGFVDGVEPKLDTILIELQGKADLTDIQPVSISNFPATQSITDSQISYTETAIPLVANGVFNGIGRDAQNKNTVRGWVWVNTNGTLYIDQSINNNTWRQIEAVAITGNATQATDFVFRLNARYYRFRYINSNTAQTSFELVSTVFGIGL